MKTEELQQVLVDHSEWLKQNVKGKRADLRGADLQGADLQGADLQGAYLQVANMQRANLQGANLQRADLQRADLQGADLKEADLQGANLQGANLQEANLQGADLRWANLRGAEVNPDDHLNHDYMIIPEEGDFIGYKSVQRKDGRKAVLTLHIPADAQRTTCLTNRKCRVSKAIPIKAEDQNGNPIEDTEFISRYRGGPYSENPFQWKLGELHEPDAFDPSPLVDCSHGIHILVTKKEAQRW